MSKNPFAELKERGFIYQSTDEAALEKALSGAPITYYVGFDPTGDSLHVGHLLPVMAMRLLQRYGHRPIALVGGATALIGDPSGKQEARPIISKEQVAHNVEGISVQLKRFLPYDNVIMANNFDWLGNIKYLDFLRDIGSKFSVNKMLTAESVKLRMETGITFLEFSYMLLQSYDYCVLNQKYGCVLEMGGQDQWGNIAAGIDLNRKINKTEVHGLTMPLLINSATKQKFGKSAGGAVWLNKDKTPVFDYYQFWRNTDDADVQRLMGYFTDLPLDEIANICKANINRAKEILAYEATALAHGHEEALKAFCSACEKFGYSDKECSIPTTSRVKEALNSSAALADLPTFKLTLPAEGIWIVKLFADAGLCKSNGDARRLIQAGGAYLNDTKITDINYTIASSDFKDGAAIIKAGKKNIKRIVLN